MAVGLPAPLPSAAASRTFCVRLRVDVLISRIISCVHSTLKSSPGDGGKGKINEKKTEKKHTHIGEIWRENPFTTFVCYPEKNISAYFSSSFFFYPTLKFFISRRVSRLRSRSLISPLLSRRFFPRATPISIFTLLSSLKYAFKTATVIPF